MNDDITGLPKVDGCWDGIEQLDNPTPAWCLWVFYVTVIWSIGYFMVSVIFPILSGDGSDYFSRSSFLEEVRVEDEKWVSLRGDILALDLEDILLDTTLLNYAQRGGAQVFGERCASCHGFDGRGLNYGLVYVPDLTDDSWLWGRDLSEIELVIRRGVGLGEGAFVSEDRDVGIMPGFEDDLSEAVIKQLVFYIYFLGHDRN